MQVTDLLAPLAVGWGRRVREELDVVPHPPDSRRQTVAGPDPDRVLVLGNGPAIGFGVLAQELGLPGHLARRIAAATGRGMAMDVLARRGTTAATAPLLVDEVRTAQYDAVLVCIGSSDAYNLVPEQRWRSDLTRLLDVLRGATTPSTVLAVLAARPLQRPNAARGRAGRLVDGHAMRLDRVAAEVCGDRAGVVHLAEPAELLPVAPRDPEAYDGLAALIAPVLAGRLDALALAPGPHDARAVRARPDPEAARQTALDRSRLLELGPNPRLDRLLRSAKELFGTTAAAVTLVDGDRVVTRAATGMPPGQAPRTISPCDRTIRQSGAHVIGRITDERITGAGWRFYAGHPVQSPDGYRIGALCVLDTVDREPDSVDRTALAEIASRVESELWAESAAATQHAAG